MTWVYTIGEVPITFALPLLDGAHDSINFLVAVPGPDVPPSMATIAAGDVETLHAYAASREPLPWGQPAAEELPGLMAANAREEARGILRRPVIWPDDQRRIVWAFQRIYWGLDPGGGPGDRYVMAIMDVGPAELTVDLIVGTDATWRALELSWDGGTINAEPAGWKNVGFDDSAWEAGYVPPDPYPTWVTIAGAGLLADLAARSNDRLKWSTYLVRKELTIPDGGSLGDGTLLLATDNWAEVYLDGVLVASLMDDHPGDGGVLSGQEYREVAQDVTIAGESLPAGTHCLAAKIYNGTRAPEDWATNPSMFEALLTVPIAA